MGVCIATAKNSRVFPKELDCINKPSMRTLLKKGTKTLSKRSLSFLDTFFTSSKAYLSLCKIYTHLHPHLHPCAIYTPVSESPLFTTFCFSLFWRNSSTSCKREAYKNSSKVFISNSFMSSDSLKYG